MLRRHDAGRKRLFIGLLIFCLSWMGMNVYAATTRTWNGGGTDANWSTSANWTGGTPVTDDPLIFNGTLRQVNLNNIANGTLARINTLTVKRAGFSISGNPLQLGGDWNITGNTTWSIDSTLYQNISITESSGGTLTFGGALVNSSHNLTLLGAGNVTFSSAISGTGGLAHYGTGTALLSVASSYSGETTIGGGGTCILRLGVNDALPRLTGYAANDINCASGSLDLNGHNLSCNVILGYGTVTSAAGALLTIGSGETAYDGEGFSGPITGAIGLAKDGTNLFYLAGSSSYAGGTTISAGTLQLRATDCLPFGSGKGDLAINGGAALDLRGSDTEINGLSGAGAVYNSSDAVDALLSVGGNDASGTFSGAIDDSLTSAQIYLVKNGAGTLTLSGTNNFRGTTEVAAGTLALSGSLAAASAVTVDAGATLSGNGTAGDSVQVDGTIAPGNGIGALNTGSETWDPGAGYSFQMSSATGTAGTNWDLLRIAGGLNVAATIGNAFIVAVSTVTNGAAGPASNFDNSQDYEWPIATVTGSITNFDATRFIVDTSQFQNDTGSGRFGIKLSSDQKSVDLVFTHTCGMNLTTSTYAIGSDGYVHMYFSNPFGLLNTVALALNNCTVAAGTAYGAGFQSGVGVDGLPLTFVGASVGLPANTTRLELVAAKVVTTQTAVVNVLVNDACGGKGGFDPVVADLQVQQGGMARETFSSIPASDRYVRIINGTPGLNWLCLTVNGQVFLLNPLAPGQQVLVDIGAAMQEGGNNVVAVCGQGVAGTSASITIGDAFGDDLTPALTPTGAEGQYWSAISGAGDNPVLQITCTGGNLVLSWPDMWDGFQVQARASLAPQASWTPLAVTPQLANGRFTATVSAGSGSSFRLYKP